MKNEKLVDETILHYCRMYVWIMKQDLSEKPDKDKMRYETQENWFGSYCPYCKVHDNKTSRSQTKGCIGCPLTILGYEYSRNCCYGYWADMSSSKTWEEFIFNMFRVVNYIRENG